MYIEISHGSKGILALSNHTTNRTCSLFWFIKNWVIFGSWSSKTDIEATTIRATVKTVKIGS